MAFRKKRTTKRRFAKKRSMKRGGKRPALKKMIRREISRQAENKTIQTAIANRFLYTHDDVLWTGNNVFPLGPDPTSLVINQGTGQGERVGNVIRTKSLMFKGTLVPRPQDSQNTTPAPVQVKMWIFYDRQQPATVPDVRPNWFQSGNTVRGFANNLTDMWAPINTDRYRILTSRTFKLGPASNTGTGGVAAYQFFANNDFKYNCNFNINLTKYYPKTVKFQDGNTSPMTRGLFVCFAYAYANGNQVADNQTICQVQYMQNYVYEDA